MILHNKTQRKISTYKIPVFIHNNDIEKNQKNKYIMVMFEPGTVVKVLVSNIPNGGYDYRLTAAAEIGTFVCVHVMNRPCVGVIWGLGDSDLPENKIKNV